MSKRHCDRNEINTNNKQYQHSENEFRDEKKTETKEKRFYRRTSIKFRRVIGRLCSFSSRFLLTFVDETFVPFEFNSSRFVPKN